MKVLETTARADGPDRLVLDTPLSELPKGRVKVIVHTEDEVAPCPLPSVDFMKALGSAYRDFPDLPRSTTDELMRELREGEE